MSVANALLCGSTTGGWRSILLNHSAKSLSAEPAAHEISILRIFVRAFGRYAIYASAKLRWRHVRSALSSYSTEWASFGPSRPNPAAGSELAASTKVGRAATAANHAKS